MNLRLGSQGKPSRQPPLETGTFKRISREAAEEPPVLSNESQAPPVRRGALTLHLPSTSARGNQRKKTDGWRRVGVLSDKQSPTRAIGGPSRSGSRGTQSTNLVEVSPPSPDTPEPCCHDFLPALYVNIRACIIAVYIGSYVERDSHVRRLIDRNTNNWTIECCLYDRTIARII